MPSQQEIRQVLSLLERTHPLTMLEELGHYTPFQMLVMTLLSARAKDSTTIPIVKEMFKKYPNPEDYVDMPQEKLQKIIFKIGFYRNKAKHVITLSRMLLEKFNGKVPETLDELVSLPGVGRKTANCILAYTFHKPAIAVDIHVHRISNRLGWVRTAAPEKTEFALMDLVPKDQWININRLLVGHGQTICSPIKPKCSLCSVREYCEYGKTGKVS
jgi:endonuclease III